MSLEIPAAPCHFLQHDGFPREAGKGDAAVAGLGQAKLANGAGLLSSAGMANGGRETVEKNPGLALFIAGDVFSPKTGIGERTRPRVRLDAPRVQHLARETAQNVRNFAVRSTRIPKLPIASGGDASSPEGDSDAPVAFFWSLDKTLCQGATGASPTPFCDGASQPPSGHLRFSGSMFSARARKTARAARALPIPLRFSGSKALIWPADAPFLPWKKALSLASDLNGGSR